MENLGAVSQPAFELHNVSKVFKDGSRRVTALKDVSLSVQPGEFVSLLGPSGCGKTTLLRIVGGLTQRSSGSFTVGIDQSGIPHRMSFVFQDINLLPWRSVQRNVELGLEGFKEVHKDERQQRSMAALRRVQLEDFAQARPYTLSGGMQQRVGLARALVLDPQILLMDEPYAALDKFTREAQQADLARLWEANRSTVLFVTHDIDEAIFLSTRIVVMGSNPGRVVEVVDVDIPPERWSYDVASEPKVIELRRKIIETLFGQRSEK